MNRFDPPRRLQIRRADKDDAREIARIYNVHVMAGGVTFDTDPWGESDTAARLSRPDPDGWYVAEDPRGVTGWASVRRFSERFGYRFTCESAIYLDPAAYGQGVADALQTQIHTHCRDRNIHHAVARIVSDNVRSIAFHQRYGYRVVGIQHEIGRINNQWVDVTIMEKLFVDA
jgi:phosphinothricin acetyltransferase